MMNERVVRGLKLSSKLLLSAAGLMALAGFIVSDQINAGQNHAQSPGKGTAASAPVYEVASIKPNKSGARGVAITLTDDSLRATNVTLDQLLRRSYQIAENRVANEPDWFKNDRYDIEAKMDVSSAEALKKLSAKQADAVRLQMLDALLEDRFKLKFHHDDKELPVYFLVVGKKVKFHEDAKDCGPAPDAPPPMPQPGVTPQPPCGGFIGFPGHLVGQKVSMKQLAFSLSGSSGEPVLDKTGLDGKYDIDLEWTPEMRQGGQFPPPPGAAPPAQPDPDGPSLFTAIQEQLGLKLVSGKGPVDYLVIDHVEKPSEN